MKLIISMMVFSLCSFSALAKNDIEAGRVKSASCVACHGMNGKVSVPMYPNLAGRMPCILSNLWPRIRKAGVPGDKRK